MSKKRDRWVLEEDEALREALSEGKSIEEISVLLGRTKPSINSRIRILKRKEKKFLDIWNPSREDHRG